MSITERSQQVVNALMDDLHERYGPFERVEKTWAHSIQRYEHLRTQFENDHLGGAGIWVMNDDGEILLVRNEGDSGWADPGGKVEPGESFEEAAYREVREETGVVCQITGVLEVHRITNEVSEADVAPLIEAIVIFEGEFLEGELEPRAGEIADVAWFAEPPDTVLYPEVRTRPFPASH